MLTDEIFEISYGPRKQDIFPPLDQLLFFSNLGILLLKADVSGMMHFWGLTIDTVTSVMLILAIGLCVDYAAHIGHAFMTARGSSRNGELQILISPFFAKFCLKLNYLILSQSFSIPSDLNT